jgi:HSP20 family molecular chaperone IbpA
MFTPAGRGSAPPSSNTLTIPQYVDTDNIDASYKQGVLQVSLPKTDEGKGRKIAVKG